MRISTSVRMLSVNNGRMLAACSGSRCDSTMAAIWGCSPLMICATAFASHPLERFDALTGLTGGDAVEEQIGLLLADRLRQHAAAHSRSTRMQCPLLPSTTPMKVSSTEVI